MNALTIDATISSSMARQRWLEAGVSALRSRFAYKGFGVPANVRVSIGWPRGSHGRGRAIGQCWYAEGSSDKHHEIFISPELGGKRMSVKILGVLAHERRIRSLAQRRGTRRRLNELPLRSASSGK
ncbi:MAG TPA: hypothetical protein VFB29_00290 [Pseudolabrys sp.]|nr:hypothetical protein [Pseudolabrys sp.]